MTALPAVRVGVVGTGVMGERHARTYADLPGADLIGVFDPDRSRSAEVVRPYGARAFESLDELLRSVDAVSIASPTTTHAAVASRALAAGVHMLVEKPFTATLGEARQLIEQVADARDAVVLVGHIERFNPVVRELQRAISGHEVRSATFRRMQPFSNRCSDTSVVQDLMIHDIDLALDLFGDNVEKVDAAGSAPMGAKLDHAISQLYMENNLSVTLIASRIAASRVRTIEVRTDESWIVADLLARTLSISQLAELDGDGGIWPLSEHQFVEPAMIHVTPFEPLRLELQHFLDCVRGDDQPLVDAVCGFRAMIYADAIEELTARVTRAGGGELVASAASVDEDRRMAL